MLNNHDYEVMRECNTCGELKDVCEFAKGYGGKPSRKCKACAAEYRRTRYKAKSTSELLSNRIARLREFARRHGFEIYVEMKK